VLRQGGGIKPKFGDNFRQPGFQVIDMKAFVVDDDIRVKPSHMCSGVILQNFRSDPYIHVIHPFRVRYDLGTLAVPGTMC
jgi:hypothetical protein